MTRFDNEALSLIKQAVWQGKPYLVIAPCEEQIAAAYRGDTLLFKEAFKEAFARDPELKQMVIDALNLPSGKIIKQKIDIQHVAV
jgi:hypothetical protein